MIPLLIFLAVAATAYPLFFLREYLRPRPYDWPVWVWRLRLAVIARLWRRHRIVPCQTHGNMRQRPAVPATPGRPGEQW